MENIIITGEVVGGAHKGRSMGFPTANIVLEPKFHNLTNGVYVAEIKIGDENFKGVANIGVHPTVGSSPIKLLEVNIFDFNRTIYGYTITVTLHNFIRGEQKFASLSQLIEQIKEDKKQVEKILQK